MKPGQGTCGGLRAGGLALRRRTDQTGEGAVVLLLEGRAGESPWWTIWWDGEVKMEHASYLSPVA